MKSKMYNKIRVYNQDMEKIGYLENAFNISYTKELNTLWTASFSLHSNDQKNDLCQPFHFVEIYDGPNRVELFRILPHELDVGESSIKTYECEHVLATLIDDVLFKFHKIGNRGVYTNQCIRYVLDKQTTKHWELGDVGFKRQFEYSWENENLLAALMSIPKPITDKYMWDFDTTSYPWTLHLRDISDEEVVAYVQYGKNMEDMTKIVDPSEIITRLYCLGFGEGRDQIGIEEITGKPYIEKNVDKYGIKSTVLVDRRFQHPETLLAYGERILEEASEPFVSYDVVATDLYRLDGVQFEEFNVGDYVRIMDDTDKKTSHVFPIVSVSKNNVGENPGIVKLKIANKRQDITSSISQIAERARINEVYSQGTTNVMQMNTSGVAGTEQGLKLRFYIPEDMVKLNALKLNVVADNVHTPFVIKDLNPKVIVEEEYADGKVKDTTYDDWVTYTGDDIYYTGYQDFVRSFRQDYDDFRPGYKSIGHADLRTGEVEVNITRIQDYLEHTHETDVVVEHKHRLPDLDHDHEILVRHDHKAYLEDNRLKYEADQVEIDTGKPIHERRFFLRTSDITEGTIAYYQTYDIEQLNDFDLIDLLPKDSSGRIIRGRWMEIEIKAARHTDISFLDVFLFFQLFTNSQGGDV